MRLNRASLRREPETAGRYSFNHPKVGSDSFVRCMAQVFRQSRRDSVPGNSESVATGDQKADGKNDPPIERGCLTKNFCNTKTSEPTRSGTFLSSAASYHPKRARFPWRAVALREGGSWVEPLKPTIWNLFDIEPNLSSDR